ncbi:LPXTG cell wall anchor domain-containing protein [Clostridia bacterium OttesenSCG-928-F22]|nr:LPXTG cell wall anchor domain-containing protein [Clostridia bacterium OttesenSCG-928-F22]
MKKQLKKITATALLLLLLCFPTTAFAASTPLTGDGTSLLPYILVGAFAVVVLGVFLVLHIRKKRK